MKILKIIRALLILSLFLFSIYYAYKEHNIWWAVFVVFSWWFFPTLYLGWINQKRRLALETYIKPFSISESVLDEYHEMSDFIFKNKPLDCQVYMDVDGIHFKLYSGLYIPWRNVRSITIMDKNKLSLANVFFSSEEKNELAKELYMEWTGFFDNKVSSTVQFIDSRSNKNISNSI